MNKGIIVGRLVRNPELVKTTNGKSIANITIATDNSKDDTTFLQITIFSKMAEVVNQYCKKGDILGVEYIVKKMKEEINSLEDEKKKLNSYFDNLDNLITLHQRELEKLKNLKKACLEKMFV